MVEHNSTLSVEKYSQDASVSTNRENWIDVTQIQRSEIDLEVDRLIHKIDLVLTKQVNTIIHHPRFQKLEASWRQLKMLMDIPQKHESTIVRIISVSWKELVRDAERAAEFDQSKLFNLIYSEEFDMPGGQPFGLLVGDYDISSGINPEYGTDDITGLESVASVAAAAFTPFLCNADPTLLDVEKFAELDREFDAAYLKSLENNSGWKRLRNNPDARFLGMTCPHILVRTPYKTNDINRIDRFCFKEEIHPDGNTLLWGSSCYAMAMVVIREFVTSGWFADIRGVRSADSGGGLVNMLPTIAFKTDKHGFASQPPVEIRFTQSQEHMLSNFGLIPLMPLPYSVDLVFNTNQSLHQPNRYSSNIANQNAQIAAMLQYVLCASRFAHFLKLIMREHVGQIADVSTLQDMLNKWLGQYCIGNDDADEFMKAKFPLRTAHIKVKEISGKPGVFSCVLQLQPHFQLDDVTASFQLLADMNDNSNTKRQ